MLNRADSESSDRLIDKCAGVLVHGQNGEVEMGEVGMGEIGMGTLAEQRTVWSKIPALQPRPGLIHDCGSLLWHTRDTNAQRRDRWSWSEC